MGQLGVRIWKKVFQGVSVNPFGVTVTQKTLIVTVRTAANIQFKRFTSPCELYPVQEMSIASCLSRHSLTMVIQTFLITIMRKSGELKL